MKIDNDLNIPKLTYSEKIEGRRARKTAKVYKKIDDKMLRDASLAAYSAGLALLLMQGCPELIAQEIENDFYDDKCNEIKMSGNPDNHIYDLIEKRFSGEEKYEVMRLGRIEDYNKILTRLMYLKNSKEKLFRFNGYECAEIFAHVENISRFPEVFGKIYRAEYDDNSPRFNTKQICKLLESSRHINNCINSFEDVVYMRDKNHKLFLSSDECVDLLINSGINDNEYNYMYRIAAELDLEKDSISIKDLLNEARKRISEEEKIKEAEKK